MTQYPRPGRVLWVGVRPQRRLPMRSVSTARAIADHGLEHDHRARSGGSRRQVTLIQSEHLRAVSDMLERGEIAPERVRRNLLVAGINVLSLRHARFRIGEVVLEGSDLCHPCSRMEDELGLGGYNAMRGHGGSTARFIVGGVIAVGDAIRWVAAVPAKSPSKTPTTLH